VTAAPSTEAPPPLRYHSLDGLRGLAASVVLITHSMLVVPAFSHAYIDPTVIPRGTLAWWATFTPLHLAWAGTEAVFLFFVLSGFVLTLPFVQGRKSSWLGYYPKRALRIYLPVWGAFVLAVCWMNVFPRRFPPEASMWVQSHTPVLAGWQVRGDLLLWPLGIWSNSALWSLTFEVMFSVLLPVYIFAGRKLPKLNLAKFVLLLWAIAAFSSSVATARSMLPMFGLGTLMAVERHRLASWGRLIRGLKFHRAIWLVLTAAALALLNSYWTVHGITTDPDNLAILVPLSRALTLLGACLAIFLAIEGAWRTWLEKPRVRWLGRRSFSLYLIHEPIVVSTAVLLGGTPNALAVLAVAVPSSLLVAEGFYRLVERPSQRLGRSIERRIDSFNERRTELVLQPTVPVVERSA
jgi:peptidoglycan/LPS O-acetylase OafA/YrhL